MSTLTEWRCQGCRRLLARINNPPGLEIEIKCRCNTVNTLKVSSDKVVADAVTMR